MTAAYENHQHRLKGVTSNMFGVSWIERIKMVIEITSNINYLNVRNRLTKKYVTLSQVKTQYTEPNYNFSNHQLLPCEKSALLKRITFNHTDAEQPTFVASIESALRNYALTEETG